MRWPGIKTQFDGLWKYNDASIVKRSTGEIGFPINLEHVYMRPEVNSNRFEIFKSRSVYIAISLRATLKSQTAFKNRSVYMGISLRQLYKP